MESNQLKTLLLLETSVPSLVTETARDVIWVRGLLLAGSAHCTDVWLTKVSCVTVVPNMHCAVLEFWKLEPVTRMLAGQPLAFSASQPKGTRLLTTGAAAELNEQSLPR